MLQQRAIWLAVAQWQVRQAVQVTAAWSEPRALQQLLLGDCKSSRASAGRQL